MFNLHRYPRQIAGAFIVLNPVFHSIAVLPYKNPSLLAIIYFPILPFGRNFSFFLDASGRFVLACWRLLASGQTPEAFEGQGYPQGSEALRSE
jgi:hypothetical protein